MEKEGERHGMKERERKKEKMVFIPDQPPAYGNQAVVLCIEIYTIHSFVYRSVVTL